MGNGITTERLNSRTDSWRIANCDLKRRPHVSQLGAAAIADPLQLVRQQSRRFLHEPWNRNHLSASRMGANRGQQVAVKLGDSAIAAKRVRNQSQRPKGPSRGADKRITRQQNHNAISNALARTLTSVANVRVASAVRSQPQVSCYGYSPYSVEQVHLLPLICGLGFGVRPIDN